MKYPALDPSVNLKTRTDTIDYDYLSQLNEKELKFLNKFTEEYNNAYYQKGKRALNKNRKEIYNKNNARNRCVYTKHKAYGALLYSEDHKTELDNVTDGKSFENNINDFIDTKKILGVETREEYEKLSQQLDQFKERKKKRNRR